MPDNDMLDRSKTLKLERGLACVFEMGRFTGCTVPHPVDLKRIRDAHRAGRWWETQRLIRLYLTSYDARLCHRQLGGTLHEVRATAQAAREVLFELLRDGPANQTFRD